MEKLERLIASERKERARANSLRASYLAEKNTQRATRLLKEWDATMQIVHNLTYQQGVLTLGEDCYNRITGRLVRTLQHTAEWKLSLGYAFA